MADRRVADSLCFRKAASGSRSFHKCTTISEQPRCFVDEEVGVAANGLPVGLRHDFRQYVTAVACAAARGERGYCVTGRYSAGCMGIALSV